MISRVLRGYCYVSKTDDVPDRYEYLDRQFTVTDIFPSIISFADSVLAIQFPTRYDMKVSRRYEYWSCRELLRGMLTGVPSTRDSRPRGSGML
jgi:hypothetical protein